MPEIKLKNEGLPIRCEICHQPDLFDPFSNHCLRCSTLILDYQSHKSSISPYYVNLLNNCKSILKNFSLSIGEICAIALMLSLTLFGAILGNLTTKFIEIFFSVYWLAHLGAILGAILGFLSLFIVAELVIIKTATKLVPLIDLKIEMLIKKSLVKK